METDIRKLIGVSEEDDGEELELEMDMEMGVKEEDGDKRSREKHLDIDGAIPTSSGNSSQRFHKRVQEVGTPSGGGSRRCRPMEEKERTKLRERHRRAITARILAGLRRHWNYNLSVRADINDVISAQLGCSSRRNHFPFQISDS